MKLASRIKWINLAFATLLVLLLPRFVVAGGISSPGFECDSMLVRFHIESPTMLQSDYGNGFYDHVYLEKDTAFVISSPVFGSALLLRYMETDVDRGLPVYSESTLFYREFPAVDIQLSDTDIRWQPALCLPENLLISFFYQTKLIEVRMPQTASGVIQLPEVNWTSIEVSWLGSEQKQRLNNFQAPIVTDEIVELDDVLPNRVIVKSPQFVSAQANGLVLSVNSPDTLIVLQGQISRFSMNENNEYRIVLNPGEETLFVSRDAAGNISVPFIWQAAGKAGVDVDIRRVGASALQLDVLSMQEDQFQLKWIDSKGYAGERLFSVSGDTSKPLKLIVDDLESVYHNFQLLKVADENEIVWSSGVDLAWDVRAEPLLASKSDTLITLSLKQDQDWTDSWQIQQRGHENRTDWKLSHEFHLAKTDSLMEFRWREKAGASKSNWSAWRILPLAVTPPVGISVSGTPNGSRLTWSTNDPWLMDQIEFIRIAGADSTYLLSSWFTGEFLDISAPARTQVSYLLRAKSFNNASAWIKSEFAVSPGLSAGMQTSPVSVGEYRVFCNATGKQMPLPPALEGSSAYLSIDDLPIVNVSISDAMLYCDWLGTANAQELMYDGAGELNTTKTTGYRLPTAAEYEELAAFGQGGSQPDMYPAKVLRENTFKRQAEKYNVREWVHSTNGISIAGNSWLGRKGLPGRICAHDEKIPDVGFRVKRIGAQ
jgi:hypothetical protein